jgi:hypothetical protein
MTGSAHSALATERASAGLVTVTPAGNAKCRWLPGSATVRLTASLVTAGTWEHSPLRPVLPSSAGAVPPPWLGRAGWVAPDGLASWLPQAARTSAAAPVARLPSPRRPTRPARVPGLPMAYPVLPRCGPGSGCLAADGGTSSGR